MKKLVIMFLIFINLSFSLDISPVLRLNGYLGYDKYKLQHSDEKQNLTSIGFSVESGSRFYNITLPLGRMYMSFLAGGDIYTNLYILDDKTTEIINKVYVHNLIKLQNLDKDTELVVEMPKDNEEISNNVYYKKIIPNAGFNIYAKGEVEALISRKNDVSFITSFKGGVKINLTPEYIIYNKMKDDLLDGITFKENVTPKEKEEIKIKYNQLIDNKFYENYKREETVGFFEFGVGLKIKSVIVEVGSGYNTNKLSLKLGYEIKF